MTSITLRRQVEMFVIITARSVECVVCVPSIGLIYIIIIIIIIIIGALYMLLEHKHLG